MYGRERRSTYKVLVGKSQGKRPFVMPRLRWENTSNIKMDLQEVGWVCTDWIYLPQDRDSDESS
jgi:hypothetical protein